MSTETKQKTVSANGAKANKVEPNINEMIECEKVLNEAQHATLIENWLKQSEEIDSVTSLTIGRDRQLVIKYKKSFKL